MLIDRDYKPTPTDSPRCWGQLKFRDQVIDKPAETEGGTGKKLCGERVTYFPRMSKPDLPDELAREWIAVGAAEAVEQTVVFRTRDQILDLEPA